MPIRPFLFLRLFGAPERSRMAAILGAVLCLTTPSLLTAASQPASLINQDSDFVMRRWIVEDGLPHNTISRILQDQRGYLWLGTGAGLVRFTGTRFMETPSAIGPKEPKPLGENIRDLTLGPGDGLLYVPASGGVMQLRNGIATAHPASPLLKGERLLEVFYDPNNGTWLGSSADDGKFLFHYQDDRMERLGREQGLVVENHGRFSFADDKLGRTWIACGSYLGWYHEGALHRFENLAGSDFVVATAREGGVWVATGTDLIRIEGTRITTLKTGAESRDITTGVRCIYEDQNRTLWVATRRLGLFYLQRGGVVHALKLNDVVTSVIQDRENNLWATTEGSGLYRITPRLFTLLDASSGMLENNSLSVCDDPAGDIWCANRSGGLMRYTGDKLVALHRADGQSIYATSVTSALGGVVWAGASEGLFKVRSGTRDVLDVVDATLREIRTLFRDARDRLWIGTATNRLLVMDGEGLHDLTREFGFEERRIAAFAEDLTGTVWAATLDQVLVGFQDLKPVKRYTRADLPGYGNIQTALVDTFGCLWLGSTQGLVAKKGDRFIRLTEREGLPDQMIYQLLEDNQGRLWVGGRRGLYTISLSELQAVLDGRSQRVSAISLGRDEGIPSSSASDGTQPNAWRSLDGRLWFTTHAGVIAVSPDSLLASRPAPLLYLDRVTADRNEVPAKPSIVIPAGTHGVDFRFDALLYSSPEKVRIRHQLLDYDPEWVETPANGEFSYVRVPAGKYTLRVQASNPETRLDARELSLSITVVPPWWRRPWVLLVTGLFSATGAILGVRFWSQRRLKRRLRQLEREHTLEQERARIARDLHDQLGGSVTQLVLLTERQKRNATDPVLKSSLGQLAWRARRIAGEVESIVWAVSPKNDTWAKLASFLEHYSARFCKDSGLEFHGEGIDTVPALGLEPDVQHHILAIVKETLNNIVKHSAATKVQLFVESGGRKIHLILRDNGKGFDPSDPAHAERNGLSNIAARVRELGATGGIQSAPGKGAALDLRVSLRSQP